jgi:hypothetical protein
LAAALRAGPADDAIIAAMRLAEQPNYSWTTSVSDDARTYTITGRTTPEGFTRVQMPVVNRLRRKLGRGVTDTQIDFIFRGNVACVVESTQGWRTPAELPDLPLAGTAATSAGTGPDAPVHVNATLGAGIGDVPVVSVPLPPAKRATAPLPYSNLQLTLSHPHEELAVIVGSHAEFKVDGDLVTGTLTEVGARLLLVHDGQAQLTPRRAGGTFALRVQRGQVVQYRITLDGVLAVEAAGAAREIIVRQTTDTVLRDIGTTRVDVPEEARAKLAPPTP